MFLKINPHLTQQYQSVSSFIASHGEQISLGHTQSSIPLMLAAETQNVIGFLYTQGVKSSPDIHASFPLVLHQPSMTHELFVIFLRLYRYFLSFLWQLAVAMESVLHLNQSVGEATATCFITQGRF